MTLTNLLLLLLAAFPALAGQGETFTASVLAVHDGDTLTVSHQRQTVRVRLSGIDCPELGQPFGPEALAFTTRLALGQTATFTVQNTDRYGRLVVLIELPDGRILNHDIVASGLAWWYRQYARYDQTVEELESVARNRRLGLWVASEQTPPWEWRKQGHNSAASGHSRSEPRSERLRRDTRRSRR